MTMLEITFSWTAARTCTPDRLRSFLEYLGNRELPLRFNYEEQSLYAASESLLIGPTPQSIRLTGYATVEQAAFTVMFADASYRISLGFHADRSVLELLESEPGISVLRAGARMLAAHDGSIDVSKTNGQSLRSHSASYRIAAWTALNSPPAQKNLVLVDEQWDGACTWLSRPLSQTFLRQAIADCLSSSTTSPRQDPVAEPASVPFIIKEALRSPDWHTRILAMLAAVRLHLTSLALDVRKMDIPDTGVIGVTNELRHSLLAMQRASLLLLGGMPIPPIEASAPATRDGMRAHLLRVVAGAPLAFEEEFSTLVRALVPQGTGA